MPIIEGLITGIGTVIFLGPVFFTLLQVTLRQGRITGLGVATGILMSDVLIVSLLYFGAADFFRNDDTQRWLAVVGSVLLLALGLKYMIKPQGNLEVKHKTNVTGVSGAFGKGFLVNFVNPFVFFVWMAILTYAEESFDSSFEISAYLVAALAGIFITDLLKVFLADKLKTLLNPTFLKRLFVGIGAILILFSLRLAYFALSQ
ncbi:MAG: LysE family transporter [Flavobacteriales bacterium]